MLSLFIRQLNVQVHITPSLVQVVLTVLFGDCCVIQVGIQVCIQVCIDTFYHAVGLGSLAASFANENG